MQWFWSALLTLLLPSAMAQVEQAEQVPAHAAGLVEERVSVDLGGQAVQVGVLSRAITAEQPKHLAVLLPGYPSVVRPEVQRGLMIRSSLTGNFLIRARRHLADQSIMTLIVDCRTDQGALCSAPYQASAQRQKDVQSLIDEVRSRWPSVSDVWLVGTSMGTISSTHMPLHAPTAYRGAIHTAGITEPNVPGSYGLMRDLDLRKSPILHVLIHHADDPCAATTYAGAQRWSQFFKIPLLTVRGGGGFEGPACMAYTEHGFRGRERDVMRAIATIITTGKAHTQDL